MTNLTTDAYTTKVWERNPTARQSPNSVVVSRILEPDLTCGAVDSNLGHRPGGESGCWSEEVSALTHRERANPPRIVRYERIQAESSALPFGTSYGIPELPEQHETPIIIIDEVTGAWRNNEEVLPNLSAVLIARKAGAAIDKLTRLTPGWDGYSGVAVLPRVAKHAREFLEAIGEFTQLVPDVVPMSDGGLQLEWFVGDYEIEVEISRDCDTQFFFECEHDGRSEEHALGTIIDHDFLATYFNEIRP